MTAPNRDTRPNPQHALLRTVWAIASVLFVECIVFALSVLPAYAIWRWHFGWEPASHWINAFVSAFALVPAYLVFAVTFMVMSAAATHVTGWRTPKDMELKLRDRDWALLDWVRYSISTHLVRVLAGTVLRTTPVWTFYMRLNGARLGKRVWINSLDVTDHNLLEFGDDVVIGAGVHLSGHTVERGRLKTAPVRLGSGVTVGINANVEIGVEAGPRCQIGALSAVPKYTRLDADTTYVGIPVHKLENHTARPMHNEE
ncbi:MAG: hypothetical protein OES09_02410 [Gammaproteobacteria bacterium]|nr:hypothetical protein [Gammaproteobacteria bacterium]